MSDAGVLNLVLFLPLLGAALLLVSPAAHDDFTRRLTLGVMIAAVRAHRAGSTLRFDSRVAGLQFETRLPWIAELGRALPDRPGRLQHPAGA